MLLRAMEGTCLAALARRAIDVCRAAEQLCPRTGPGRPPEYHDWQMAVLITLAVLKRRKSKSAQYRCLQQHSRVLVRWLGLKRFPSRGTYFQRYRRAHAIFELAIRLQGRQAIRSGLAQPQTVAVDKSVVPARGPEWSPKLRRANRLPRRPGLDREADWVYSPHHGWVYGYSYEVVVTATSRSQVFPLLASAGTASASEHVTFGEKIEHLPRQTTYVVADAGYDNVRYAERIECDERGRRTGRRFACPLVRRGRPSRHRKRRAGAPVDPRRRRRQRFCQSATGRRLLARRSRTVEPFNEWLKDLFELHSCVWHRGLDNNRTQLLAAILSYQLLVRYNHRRGRCNARIKWILDSL